MNSHNPNIGHDRPVIRQLDDAAIKQAITAALDDIDPTEDNRGPVAFKMHVAGVILTRAIRRAWSRA